METRLRAVPRQFEVMIQFMERHNDLAKTGAGGRIKSDRLWRQLTIILNSVSGGVKKSTNKWKKVWADWKAKSKKKNILLQRKTPAGDRVCNKLTALEQRVVKLMCQPQAIVTADQQTYDWEMMDGVSPAGSSPPGVGDHDYLPDPLAVGQVRAPETPVTSVEVQPCSTQIVEEEQGNTRNTPTPPQSRYEKFIPQPRVPRIRIKSDKMFASASSTPFERAADEFVAVEERRLQLEEAKDQRLHERERMLHEREKMLHEREMERLQVEARRLDIEQARNGLLQQLGDVPQLLAELLLRFKTESSEKVG